MSILIAEDNRVSAKLLEMQLASLGFETTTVGSGTAVLDLLRARADVELLITDLSMPGMDGVDLIRAIRADAAWCHLPIVVASGMIDLSNAKQVASLGVNHYLLKPVQRAQLESTVRGALAENAVPLVAAAEVMERLSLDEEAYRALAASLLEMVEESIARLASASRRDVVPEGLPVRELQEAVALFRIEPLAGLLGRLANPAGGGQTSVASDLDRLSVQLRLVARTLRLGTTDANVDGSAAPPADAAKQGSDA